MGILALTKELAKEQKVTEIVLDVWQFNQTAIEFFTTHGFNLFNLKMSQRV